MKIESSTDMNKDDSHMARYLPILCSVFLAAALFDFVSSDILFHYTEGNKDFLLIRVMILGILLISSTGIIILLASIMPFGFTINQVISESKAFIKYKIPHFFNRLWVWNGFICELHNPVAFKVSLVYLSSVPVGVKIRNSLDPLFKDYFCKLENINLSYCTKLENVLQHFDLPFNWIIGFYASVFLVLSFVITKISRPIFFHRYTGSGSFVSNLEDFRHALDELELDRKGALFSKKLDHFNKFQNENSIANHLRILIRNNDINLHHEINAIEDHFNHKRTIARVLVVIMSIIAYSLFAYLAWEQLCWVITHSKQINI
jgi:hypothetical protein